MGLKITKEPVAYGKAVCDLLAEQSVESDIMLPDYLPGVMRVMSCKAEPKVVSAECGGKKLQIEGVTLVEIFYLSEEGEMCSIEQKLPFSKSIELKSDTACPITMFSARVDYLNCRAVSSQRVEVRGAFTLGVKVISGFERESITDAQECGIQLKKDEISCICPLGESRSKVTVREELDIPDRDKATSVIRTSAMCENADCKIVAGKIVAKSEIRLHILYNTENNGIQSMDYRIPVSQMTDIAGLAEDCSCHVRFEPCTVEVSVAEGGSFSAEITVLAISKVFKETQNVFARDAYSTAHPCRTGSENLTFITAAERIDERINMKDVQELPEGLGEIKDLWCEIRAAEIKNTDEGIEAECRALVRIIALDGSGQPCCLEKSSSFVWKKGVAEGNAVCDLNFAVNECSYSIDSAGRADIRVEVGVSGVIYKSGGTELLASIEVDEEKRNAANSAALIIYYADEGETVWNISKRYSAEVSAVMEENALENSVIGSRTMLLIPMA
ncbi:MAG: DUF3794 domain-containing protein [Oscillospiraceae bacterium]|nr:DUF3794 domain-containing protein [Oscillospiraceae bacterium]